MYTLVMMTALATTPEVTQFNGFFRDLAGGSGCRGDNDSRSDSTKERGSSCTGCCGGGLFHGRIISFFSFGGRGSCNGSCNGRSAGAGSSCHGSSCHGSGCNGSRRELDYGSSCQGSGNSASCFGSTSCLGSTFAPMSIPNAGYPGEYAQPMSTNSGYGNGCFGSGMPSNPMNVPSGGYDYSPPTSVPSERDTYRPTVVDDSNRGIVIVRLPEDAKLFAEGKLLVLKTDVRRFVTPPLATDREAISNIRVEYTRAGEVITRTKRVQIRAGDTKTIEFTEQTALSPSLNPPELFADKPTLGSPMAPIIPTPSLPTGTPTVNKPQPLPPLSGGTVTVTPPPQALSDRAKITVKLPTGATLFVDSKKNDRAETTREFTTPVLKKGDLYTYTLRAEWNRNGRAESEERKVEFMAGELHTVDFTLPNYRVSK